jgi:hypothetical protein
VEESAMNEVTLIGIDLGKHVFHGVIVLSVQNLAVSQENHCKSMR